MSSERATPASRVLPILPILAIALWSNAANAADVEPRGAEWDLRIGVDAVGQAVLTNGSSWPTGGVRVTVDPWPEIGFEASVSSIWLITEITGGARVFPVRSFLQPYLSIGYSVILISDYLDGGKVSFVHAAPGLEVVLFEHWRTFFEPSVGLLAGGRRPPDFDESRVIIRVRLGTGYVW